MRSVYRSETLSSKLIFASRINVDASKTIVYNILLQYTLWGSPRRQSQSNPTTGRWLCPSIRRQFRDQHPHRVKRTSAEHTLLIGFAALATATVALFAVFFAPVEAIQQSIVLVDHDNSTTPLRLPLVRALRWMSLAASIFLLALGGLAYAKRSRLLEVLSIFIDDVRGYRAAVAAEIRALLVPGERWKLGVLALFFVVGLALRLAALDAPMRYDESYTFNYHGLRDVLNIVSDYTTPNNHIFQSVLVHFSYQLFGASPTALRLPALLAGVLLVPASFWLLRRLFADARFGGGRFDDGPALIAAGLVALSAPLIGYSANARGYTWLTLLFLVGFTLATRLIEKRNLAVWALFVVVFTLGFFTIPVMLYGYAVVSMWMLLSVSPDRRKTLLVELVVASAAVASLSMLLYIPAAVRCTIQNIVANPFVRPLPFSIWATYFPQLPGGLADYATHGLPLAVKILLLVGLAGSVLLPGGRGKSQGQGNSARRLHLAILLTLPPLMAAQQVVPFLRVLVFLVPIYAGLAVAGLAGLLDWAPRSPVQRWKRVLFVTATLVVVSLGCLQLYTRQQPRGLFADLPKALDTLHPLLGQGERNVEGTIVAGTNVAGTIVTGIPLSEPLLYHAERAGLPRRVLREFLPYSGDRQLNRYRTIYFLEEKKPPKRSFASFEVRSLRVSHPAFKTYFEPPEQVGETEFTTWYRLRRKDDS